MTPRMAENVLLTIAAVCLALTAYWQISDAIHLGLQKVSAAQSATTNAELPRTTTLTLTNR